MKLAASTALARSMEGARACGTPRALATSGEKSKLVEYSEDKQSDEDDCEHECSEDEIAAHVIS